MSKKKILLPIFILALFLLFTSQQEARTTYTSITIPPHSPIPSISGLPNPTTIQAKLSAAKLTACQNSYAAIVANSNKALASAQNIYTELTYSAQATETYYNTQVKITGKTVANYSTLVATVQTTGSAVTPLIQTTTTDLTGFNCSTTNPFQTLQAFGQSAAKTAQALVAYQKAVEALILAVQTVAPIPTTTQ